MALSITAAGKANSVVSSATLAFDSGATWAHRDMIVVCVTADNNGTNGASSIASVTDAAGHTYEQRRLSNNDPGAAAAGVTLAIYTAPVGVAGMGSTDDITVNFSPATTAKCAAVWKVTPGAGGTVRFLTSGGATGSSTTQTVTTGTIVSGDAVIGACGIESLATWTADTDTTRGSWSTQVTEEAAIGAATSVDMTTQYKITSGGDGTQTYNPDTGIVDWAIGYIVLHEDPIAVATGIWGAWSATAAATVTTPGVEAVATGTWGAWAATAAATVKHPATAVGSWGAWQATVNAAVAHTATAEGAWGGWTATASGGPVRYGTSDGTWGGWAGTAAAVVNHPSAAVGDWGTWLATVSAGISHTAAAAGTWGAWGATAAGVTGRAGVATAEWGSWSGTVAPVVSHPAAAAAAWGGWAGTVSATVTPPVAAGGSRMLVYYAKRHRKKPSG